MTNDEKIQEIIDRENITIASMPKRILAFILDFFLVSFIVVLAYSFGNDLSYLESLNESERLVESAKITSALLPPLCASYILYFSIFTKIYGASLGKIFFKIRVVSVDLLDNPNWAMSIFRAFLWLVSVMFYCVPFVFAFGDTFKRGLHDRFSKTIVIEQN